MDTLTVSLFPYITDYRINLQYIPLVCHISTSNKRDPLDKTAKSEVPCHNRLVGNDEGPPFV